jgi:predicted NUDIX family NTP pyrophosphohydrolase
MDERQSADSCSIVYREACASSSSSTPAARSGRRRTRAPGRSRKGEIEPGEDALAAAKRELAEETGIVARGECLPLGSVKQKSGKLVHAWALEQDADAASIRSNTFTLGGRRARAGQEFPEIDRAAWFDLATARLKILAGQRELLERLTAHLGLAQSG